MFSTMQGRRRALVSGARRMPWRRLTPVVLATALSWFALSAPGGATTPPVVAAWEMDEPAGAATLVDSGGAGLSGSIGDHVVSGALVQGSTAHRRSTVAPDTSPLDPERLAVVPDDDRLDPGAGALALTVRLRTTSPQGNVVQKGQSSSTGGYYKIDMDGGRVACVFTGSAGGVHLQSSVRVDDGAWHEVRCVRSADEVVLLVDGDLAARRSVQLGTVANTWAFTIGGKGSCNQASVGCDYFSGDLDRVVVEHSTSWGTPPPPTTTVVSTEPPTAPTTVTSAPSTTAAPATTTTRPPSTTTTVPRMSGSTAAEQPVVK